MQGLLVYRDFTNNSQIFSTHLLLMRHRFCLCLSCSRNGLKSTFFRCEPDFLRLSLFVFYIKKGTEKGTQESVNMPLSVWLPTGVYLCLKKSIYDFQDGPAFSRLGIVSLPGPFLLRGESGNGYPAFFTPVPKGRNPVQRLKIRYKFFRGLCHNGRKRKNARKEETHDTGSGRAKADLYEALQGKEPRTHQPETAGMAGEES